MAAGGFFHQAEKTSKCPSRAAGPSGAMPSDPLSSLRFPYSSASGTTYCCKVTFRRRRSHTGDRTGSEPQPFTCVGVFLPQRRSGSSHCQKSAVSVQRHMRQARKQGHGRFCKWPAASTIAPFLSQRHKQQAHKSPNGTKHGHKKKRRHRNGSNKRDGNLSRASRWSRGEDTTRLETGTVPRNGFQVTPQATAPAVRFHQALARHQRVQTQEPQVSGAPPSPLPRRGTFKTSSSAIKCPR